MILRYALPLLTLAVAALADVGDDEALDAAFERDVLIVVASRHACHRFDVYLAESYEQQVRGLMHVRSLPDTSGMLFVYQDERLHSMWMKNTFIPLDIAFARSDGTIVTIARETEPLSLRSIGSGEPVSYVLELNAGISDRLSIEAGSRMLWGPIFEQ